MSERKPVSAETREKMAAARRGKKHSPETIEKMRQAKLGKKQSPEHIEARTAKLRGRKRSPEAIEATRQARLGSKQSPEAVERQRASLKKRFEDPRFRQANKDRQRAKWIGHKYVRRGYVFLWIPPDHPLAAMRVESWKGYCLEHRFVMAQHLGRPLVKTELVHHVNFVRGDNRIENLQLMSRSEHMRLHNRLRAESS